MFEHRLVADQPIMTIPPRRLTLIISLPMDFHHQESVFPFRNES